MTSAIQAQLELSCFGDTAPTEHRHELQFRAPSTGGPAAQARNAAYRRLVATVLGLDVATLSHELRARRLELEHSEMAA
jgi:hypothetical protein